MTLCDTKWHIDQVNIETLSITIKGIERELRTLRKAAENIASSQPSNAAVPHFADLCGVWKGKVDLSFEEIAEAKYRVKPFPKS